MSALSCPSVNTRLRLFHLLYDTDFIHKTTNKTRIFDQSERAKSLIYIINSADHETWAFDKS